MINPIHHLATSAASTVEAALQLPRYVGLYAEGPEALAANLPPQVQRALAQIEDPDQRYWMTLIVLGDAVPAGVPAGIPGPDLTRGHTAVADYLGQLLQTLRATQADPNADQIWGDDVIDNLDESIAQIEDLLRNINPNHPALLPQNIPTTGQLDLFA